MSLLDRKIIIVTGKGGVGKSTVAASIAIKAAHQKKRVLLVELGDESFFAPFFGLKSVTNIPLKVQPYGFDLALWDSESCLREYVLHFIKVDAVFRLFFDNKIMRTFINVAPALKELAILGKLTSGERKVGPAFNYDIVILDGYATGHMLALLRAPKGMSESIRSGPMGVHSAEILRVLTDPKITGYVTVTLPDEMPTVEALELKKSLHDEFQIQTEIFVNRILEPPLNDQDLKDLRAQINETSGLGAFLRYLDSVVTRQRKNIARLLDSGSKITKLNLKYLRNAGQDVAEALAEDIL